MMHRKTVFKTSIFPSSEEQLWKNLMNPKMMQYVASPRVTLTPLHEEDFTDEWVEGKTYQFQVRALGILPIGTHTIIPEQINPEEKEIRFTEFNNLVPVWNHTLYLRKVNDSNTLLADKVEVFSGWTTPSIARWAEKYFAQCHHKIRLLLDTPEQTVPEELPDPKEELVQKALEPKTLLTAAAVITLATGVIYLLSKDDEK